MTADPLHRVAVLLREAAEILDALQGAPQDGGMRDTPLPAKPSTPPAPAQHRAQREYLVGWFQSHGCRVVARRQRWTTLADPSGCHWQVATWRVFRLDGKARTHDLDALVLYALIGSGRELELRPATLAVVLPTYGRVAGQLVRVDRSGRYRG